MCTCSLQNPHSFMLPSSDTPPWASPRRIAVRRALCSISLSRKASNTSFARSACSGIVHTVEDAFQEGYGQV